MTRRQNRVWRLVVLPPCSGLTSALMAPLFGNPPAAMLLVGTLVGLLVGAIWLAIEEAGEC